MEGASRVAAHSELPGEGQRRVSVDERPERLGEVEDVRCRIDCGDGPEQRLARLRPGFQVGRGANGAGAESDSEEMGIREGEAGVRIAQPMEGRRRVGFNVDRRHIVSEFGERAPNQQTKDLLAAADVEVERRRADAKPAGKLAHRHDIRATLFEKGAGLAEDAVEVDT